MIIAVSITKKQLTDVIHKQQLAFAEYISNDIDTEVKKSLAFFKNLAKELSDKNTGKESLQDIELLKGRHIPPNFKHGIVLISPDGKGLIAEYPVVPGRKDISFAKSRWFQRAKLSDGAVFSRPFKNRINLKPSIVFAASVKDKSNRVVCVVAGIVELDQPELFEHLTYSAMKGGCGVLVISPDDKLFIYSNIQEMILKPTPKPGRNLLHDRAMDGYRGVGVTLNAFGVEELSAIAGVESTGWFVVVRLPAAEAYLPVKHLTTTMVTYNIFLIFTVILIIAAVLFTMLSPLKRAAGSVRKMAKGELPVTRLPVLQRNEIGDLIDGFNSLVDTIDERTLKLETAKQDLEKSIEEIKQLSGLLPICASCKKIRDDKGYWNLLESYIEKHSDASFSHSLCPDCSDKLYGEHDWYRKMKKKKEQSS